MNFTQEVSIIEEKLRNKKNILQFLPKNLESLINGRDIIIYQEKRLKSTFIIDIVHGLLLKYFTTLKHGIGEVNFNLSSLILREKYGNTYSFYLKYLVENKILELTSDYLVGKD
jgi:hypothetical protein